MFEFPNTNFHELNLDWVIGEIKKLRTEYDEFKVVNQISFGGAWNITKNYPEYTIVDLDGNGYISIKPVPAGVPIDNDDYWRLVANYSALYADFQERVIALENSTQSMNTRLGTVETSIDNFGTRLTETEETVFEMADDVDLLTDRLNKHIILIGDSYVQGVGGTGLDIETTIESLTNWDVRSFYSGGSGFIRVNDDNKRYIDVLNEAIAATSDKDVITDVVFAGSVYNDVGASGQSDFTATGFYNAINACINLVKNNFPNATPIVIPALWVNVSYNMDFVKVSRFVTYGAERCGCRYSPNAINWLMTKNNATSSDNIHPNHTGYEYIAQKITCVLNGSNGDVRDQYDSITTTTGDVLHIICDGDFLTLYGTVSKKSSASFTNLGTIPSIYRYLANYPIKLYKYGDNDLGNSLVAFLTGGKIVIGSDYMQLNTNYVINERIPVVAAYTV